MSARCSDSVKIANVLRRHVTGPSELPYTDDLKGPLDGETLIVHRRLIRDARQHLGTCFVQKNTAEAFDLIAADFADPLDSQTWSDSEARNFRAMMRHVQQAVSKAKVNGMPGWLSRILKGTLGAPTAKGEKTDNT